MVPMTKEPNWQSAPLFIISLLLAAGAFWTQGPLDGERPKQTDRAGRISEKNGDILKVDARLWQDPFGVVRRDDNKAQKKAGDLSRLVEAANEKCKAPVSCTVLGVMVVGGPYVGMEEHRRSTRYAVLAGLQQESFVPTDPEHIRYIKTRIAPGESTLVPFEWLEQSSNDKKVLVLWLDEEDLNAENSKTFNVLTRLGNIFEPFTDPKQKLYKVALLGPTLSGTLLAMAKAHPLPEAVSKVFSKLHIYSATATSDKAWESMGLASKASNKNLPPLNITRTIAIDSKLVELLVAELTEKRDIGSKTSVGESRCLPSHFRVCDEVLLVTQRDNAYSLNLTNQFKSMLRERGVNTVVAHYLRGIDGRHASSESTTGSGDKSDKDGNKESSKDNGKDKSTIERPEGDAQVDYLRRLAVELADQQRRSGHAYRAVGVLGSDYHDKLMVLKAMRPVFPQAVFFTTDLNAAMFHPQDNRVTRNMLVASAFGLSLNREIQNGVSPFRSSYQTSAYLATRMAVTDALNKAPAFKELIETRAPPLLFEIGRNTSVPLHDIPQDSEMEHKGGWWQSPNWQATRTVNPQYKRWVGVLIIFLAGPVLCALLFTPFKKFTHEHWPAIAITILVAAGVTGYIFWKLPNPLGEPFTWLEGISVWPTEILRAVAMLLALFFIYLGIQNLQDGDKLSASLFGIDSNTLPSNRVADKTWNINAIWWLYQSRGIAVPELNSWFKRKNGILVPSWGWLGVCRQVWPQVVLYVIIGFGLVWALGRPMVPARGEIFILDRILLISVVVSFSFLLFFVLDACRRARWLAHRLAENNSWPEATLRKFGLPHGKKAKFFDHWMDVQLIATATTETGKLVYYPFVVFFLMLVARSPLFDNWNISWALVFIFGTAILLMLSAGIRLRRAAERTRRVALRQLQGDLLSIVGKPGEEATAKQINMMMEQVRDIRMGVFSPITQQPLVRAILGLVSGASGLALLEYANITDL